MTLMKLVCFLELQLVKQICKKDTFKRQVLHKKVQKTCQQCNNNVSR